MAPKNGTRRTALRAAADAERESAARRDTAEDRMLSTTTLWFDAAIVLAIFAVGSILFGHFEEHKPKWRRLLKLVIVLGVVLTVSATVGRIWAYSLLAIPLLGAAYVHLRWLPAHGVNGWTGEPKERYLELVAKERGRPDTERPA